MEFKNPNKQREVLKEKRIENILEALEKKNIVSKSEKEKLKNGEKI